MRAELDWTLAGEPMRLLGDRALYWPARQRLLIADLHLGKADAFRRAGIGLPRGGTALDLARLSALVQAQDAAELWILGDVLHGAAPDADWQRQWHAWRGQHPQLQVAAIAGNHDRALAGAGLDIALLGTQVEDGPFVLRHDPATDTQRHVLCGHLHPLVKLPGVRPRWPAFWLRDGMTVLPAFSHFTAGVAPVLAPGERLVACVEGAALALPVAAA